MGIRKGMYPCCPCGVVICQYPLQPALAHFRGSIGGWQRRSRDSPFGMHLYDSTNTLFREGNTLQLVKYMYLSELGKPS